MSDNGEARARLKVLTFNIWAGRVRDVYGYLASVDADVIMLQEVISSDGDCGPYDGKCFHRLSEALDGYDIHASWFCSGLLMGRKVEFPILRGLVVAAKKDLGSRLVFARSLFPWRKDDGRYGYCETGNFMAVECCGMLFVNVHGLVDFSSKHDTPEKTTQSKEILDVVLESGKPFLIGGDFNLMPDTESMKMLEKHSRNLVKQYGIESTRTRLTKLYDMGIRHSSYVLVNGLDVLSFSVEDVELSDHKPLIAVVRNRRT